MVSIHILKQNHKKVAAWAQNKGIIARDAELGGEWHTHTLIQCGISGEFHTRREQKDVVEGSEALPDDVGGIGEDEVSVLTKRHVLDAQASRV